MNKESDNERRFHEIGNYHLDHNAPEDFCRSQWQTEPRCMWFLLHRWLLGGSFTIGVLGCVRKYYWGGKWFLYLTNWGFLLCAVTGITGAILITLYQTAPEEIENHKTLIKFYWALYWSNLVSTYIIASFYWTYFYPADRLLTNPTRVSDLYNLWTHALPPILWTYDLLLVAQPARLMHFIYPMTFLGIYMGFSLCYHFVGGTDPIGRDYIYKFLNWNRPYKALCTCGLTTILTICCSTMLFGLSKVRTWLGARIT